MVLLANESPRVFRRLVCLSQAAMADLSGANLRYSDLSGADLRDANLKDAKLGDAKLGDAIICKTLMPWGEDNSGCK
jgi:hypothetical protein